MSRVVFITALFLSILLLGCKKDEDNPIPEKLYSKWTIDKETFTTDKTTILLVGGTGQYGLGFPGHNGSDSAFIINIYYSESKPLDNDSFAIHGPGLPEECHFLFNDSIGRSYNVYDNSNTYLYTKRINGKLRITLPPTYFRRLIPAAGGGLTPDFSDTTIIQGVFYEP